MSGFRIKTCVLGMVGTNCYIVYQGKEAVIIDPGDNAPYILNMCKELGVIPSVILLTHGHFDHILAVKELQRAFHAALWAGEAEKELLEDPSVNLSGSMGGGVSLRADRLLRDGEVLELLGVKWKVIATPGHTAGSVCYFVEEEEVLFSGDTLFEESLGRTDFPTASAAAIVSSITEKLFVLPEGTKVYPGHGDSTDIGHEKQYNPVSCCRG